MTTHHHDLSFLLVSCPLSLTLVALGLRLPVNSKHLSLSSDPVFWGQSIYPHPIHPYGFMES